MSNFQAIREEIEDLMDLLEGDEYGDEDLDEDDDELDEDDLYERKRFTKTAARRMKRSGRRSAAKRSRRMAAKGLGGKKASEISPAMMRRLKKRAGGTGMAAKAAQAAMRAVASYHALRGRKGRRQRARMGMGEDVMDNLAIHMGDLLTDLSEATGREFWIEDGELYYED